MSSTVPGHRYTDQACLALGMVPALRIANVLAIAQCLLLCCVHSCLVGWSALEQLDCLLQGLLLLPTVLGAHVEILFNVVTPWLDLQQVLLNSLELLFCHCQVFTCLEQRFLCLCQLVLQRRKSLRELRLLRLELSHGILIGVLCFFLITVGFLLFLIG